MNSYEQFLESKLHYGEESGFDPVFMPDMLFDFQKFLVTWNCMKGRSGTFADCGLGKTLMQLTWAENIARHTGKPVLILTPLAVSFQTQLEGQKIGLDVSHRREGIKAGDSIIVTNYERLHYFDRHDFAGVVCDESSILKNFKGSTKAEVTDFMRKMPYRLLCTATAAPNDYIELGTSAEALGVMGYIDMLKTFFKANDNKYAQGGSGHGQKRFEKQPFGGDFRFRGHAEKDFWRWVCSWARAMRKPSDLGFSDEGFALPDLITNEHMIEARRKREGFLFDLTASNNFEQREEQRRTYEERCEMSATIINGKKGQSIAWCQLNDEGGLLEKLIPGAVEVEGSDDEDFKAETFRSFAEGKIKCIVSKPTIAGFGLNWQNCAHMTFFPSHSYEQLYQAVRRCWRFGQKNAVTVDMITTEGQSGMLRNLNRKTHAAERMFGQLVEFMGNELKIKQLTGFTKKVEIPKWM